MALFVDLVALSNGLHGSVQMDSVALFSWIGWLRHHGILTRFPCDLKFIKEISVSHFLKRESTLSNEKIIKNEGKFSKFGITNFNHVVITISQWDLFLQLSK